MHEIKLLSWRTKAEVEAKDLMTKNSMVGHNQEIDLSLRELENASIVGKNGHRRRDCWHWNKNQTEGKDEKNDNDKITIATVIAKDVLVLSIEEQKCEYVAKNDVE